MRAEVKPIEPESDGRRANVGDLDPDDLRDGPYIFAKLRVNTRTEAVLKAVKLG